MVALPAFRLGTTLGLGIWGAHAGGNAFLESRKNPVKRGRIGSTTYMGSCLQRVFWGKERSERGLFK